MPKTPVAVAAPADLDAFAAAAFADDPAGQAGRRGDDLRHLRRVRPHLAGRGVEGGEERPLPGVPQVEPGAAAEEGREGRLADRGRRADPRQAGHRARRRGGVRRRTRWRDRRRRPPGRSSRTASPRRSRRNGGSGGSRSPGTRHLVVSWSSGPSAISPSRARNEVKSDAKMEDAVKEVEKEGPQGPAVHGPHPPGVGRTRNPHGSNRTRRPRPPRTTSRRPATAHPAIPAPGVDRNVHPRPRSPSSMADLLGTPDEVQDGKRIE